MHSTAKARFFLIGAAVTAAVLLVSSAPGETPPATADPGVTEVPLEIPKAAKDVRNPTAGSPEAIESGKLMYSSQCTMCHGSKGDGKGDLAITLKYRMPDLSSAEVQRARTDGEWFYILSHGHGKMTGEEHRLKEQTRWELVSYMRTLGP